MKFANPIISKALAVFVSEYHITAAIVAVLALALRLPSEKALGDWLQSHDTARCAKSTVVPLFGFVLGSLALSGDSLLAYLVAGWIIAGATHTMSERRNG